MLVAVAPPAVPSAVIELRAIEPAPVYVQPASVVASQSSFQPAAGCQSIVRETASAGHASPEFTHALTVSVVAIGEE